MPCPATVGWHASVENSHLNCRSCSCARSSPCDCSRLIDSSKQREQLRHGTLRARCNRPKDFPTAVTRCHTFVSSALAQTNYSVSYTRLPRWERTYDRIADTWKVGRTGSSCSPLAMHGERNTPLREGRTSAGHDVRAFQDSQPVGITNYGASCLSKSRTYLCLMSKYTVNRTVSLAIFDKTPKLFYWLIERWREYVIPRLSINWIRFLNPTTRFVSF